jgi:hypothetical protein
MIIRPTIILLRNSFVLEKGLLPTKICVLKNQKWRKSEITHCLNFFSHVVTFRFLTHIQITQASAIDKSPILVNNLSDHIDLLALQEIGKADYQSSPAGIHKEEQIYMLMNIKPIGDCKDARYWPSVNNLERKQTRSLNLMDEWRRAGPSRY